mgnify:CR=1 FL=1
MFFDIKKFASSDNGATAIEYGLIAALIALAIIGGLAALGGSNGGMWDTVGQKVNEGLDKGG